MEGINKTSGETAITVMTGVDWDQGVTGMTWMTWNN